MVVKKKNKRGSGWKRRYKNGTREGEYETRIIRKSKKCVKGEREGEVPNPLLPLKQKNRIVKWQKPGTINPKENNTSNNKKVK